MTLFEWIQAVGVVVGVLAAVGALAYFRALNTLVHAQMKTNGGSTLLDKANLIVDVKKDLADLSELVKANHEEGRTNLGALRDEDQDIRAMLNPLIDMAESLKRSLPDAMRVQEGLVLDVGTLKSDVAALHEDVALLKQKVFGDE